MRLRRSLEWISIFVALPVILLRWLPSWSWGLVLWAIAAVAVWQFRSERGREPPVRSVWRGQRHEIYLVLRRFGISAVLLVAAVLIFTPGSFLDFPRRRTLLWAAVIIGYPLLSAYPQELVYRRWFVRRYTVLFGDGPWLGVACALAFGWVHVLLRNSVAIGLTVVGGWFFLRTYWRSGSVWLATLEHSLYGVLLFTIGLGRYFIV